MIISNKFFLIFCISFFSLIIIILIISKIECSKFIFKNYDILNLKNSTKLKLIFISDFHNKYYKNNFEDLINKIVDIKADYIILGGDFLNYSKLNKIKGKVGYKNAILFINCLLDKINHLKANENYDLKGILFGYGNHELRLLKNSSKTKLNYDFYKFRDFLINNSIKIIDNNTYKLDNGLNISGLSLYDGYYGKSASKRLKSIDKSILNRYFKDIIKSEFNIMLFHKPDYAENLIDYGYDLVLSGHNHGGLINIPFIGPIISSELTILPKYAKGLYNYKNGKVIVSAGLGEHTIKLRVNNLPEVVVVNIYNG